MEIISKESLELVFSQLEKVAAKLGVGMDYLWPMMVKQQYIDAIWVSFIFVLSIIIFGISGFFMNKYWKPEEGYSIYNNNHECPWVVGIIVLGVVAFICGIEFLIKFPHIFNAEYWALKDLIMLVK